MENRDFKWLLHAPAELKLPENSSVDICLCLRVDVSVQFFGFGKYHKCLQDRLSTEHFRSHRGRAKMIGCDIGLYTALSVAAAMVLQ